MKEYKRDKRVLIPRDEFEEEAGEGLGGLGRDEAEADLLELRARMERRLRRPRAIWLPAAAAVVILLVASALLVTMLRDRRVPVSEEVLAGTAVTDTAYIAMAEPVEKQDIEVPAYVTTESDAVQTRELRYSPLAEAIENEIAGVAVADEIIVADEQKADDDVVYMVSAGLQEELAEVVVVEALPQIITTGMGIRSKTAERETVPAAGSRKDEDTIEAAAKKEAAVVPAATRKETKAVDVPTEGRKDTVAAPAAAAVTGAAVPDDPILPDGGWIKYRGWVAQNIRYPEGITPVVRQEVMVSFTVRADSTLADIKVIRSPGEPFTAEVSRLLREGPRWVPARIGGNAAGEEVVLMFVFK
jgi:hypothetical protein